MNTTALVMIVIGSALGLVAGFVMHRSDFCIAGMFRDLFLFRRTTMLHSLVVLIAVSMLLVELCRLGGLVGAYPFPLLGPPSLATIFGGFLFGIGMVLAGGCVVGTLYKMGAGSVPSLIAFIGLLLGSLLYAEIHPWWLPLAAKTVFSKKAITVPQLFGIQPTLPVLLCAAVALPLIARWARTGTLIVRSYAEGYVQPWKTALVLALCGLFSYLLIGMPLGITTAYAKMASYLENMINAPHVASLAYFNAVPLNYTPPIGGGVLSGGAGPVFDAISIIQFPVIAGIVLGSALSALLLGEFRLHYKVPPRQICSALAGGVIMALASRMAPACNIWHLLGGLPIFALQSMCFTIGLLPGAWLGGKLFLSLVMKEG